MMKRETHNSRGKERYAAPEVSVLDFALEKGFAGSPLYPKGSNPATKDYGGEEMVEETWNVSNF